MSFATPTKEIFATKLNIACRQIRALPSFQAYPASGSPLALLNACDASGYRPIHYAAVAGNIELTTLLANLFSWLGAQSAIDARDSKGQTALHWAVMKGHGPVIQSLVEYGSLVNVVDFQGRTPLYLAVSALENCRTYEERRFVVDLVRFLLERGANPNCPDVENGSFPLHLAAELGNEEVVTLLVENGACVNAQDNEGETPLFGAIRERHTDIVKQLVTDFKADTLCQNDDGETPVDYCRAIGDEFMVRLLQSMAVTSRPLETRARPVHANELDDFSSGLSLSAGSRFSWDTLLPAANPLAC